MTEITKELEEDIYWTLRAVYEYGKAHTSKNIRKEARMLIEKIKNDK